MTPYPPSYTRFLTTLPYTPSAEQTAVVDAVLASDDNLLISALAGAAKTSTLKMIAHALPKANMACLAFNKSIATEMAKELPSNCTCLTLHSLGMKVWKAYIKTNISVQKGKMYDLLAKCLESGEYSPEERDEISEDFTYILKTCGYAKNAGHLPDNFVSALHRKQRHSRLMDDDDLIMAFDEKVSPLTQQVILSLLNRSAQLSMKGQIDFDDMVAFPSLFKCMYPIHSLILVDEAQDLSPLNHLMLEQLYRRRIIAVGDQNQAIYAFRGAFETGMKAMAESFDMTEHRLTTTFRCPEEVVEHVRWRAPEMQAFEHTPSGSVDVWPTWTAHALPDECAILCRNNAPLLECAIRLLKAGRYPKLWGNDIASGLMKIMKDLGPKNMDSASAIVRLSEWRDKRLKKVKNAGPVHDRYECIALFLREQPTLGQALTHLNEVFRSSGRVDLMTCHKSKGSEFDNVFILNEEIISEEGQDPNLRYVAATRSKRNLTYITSKGYVS